MRGGEHSKYLWKEKSLNKLGYIQSGYTKALKMMMQIMKQYFRYIYDWLCLKKNKQLTSTCVYMCIEKIKPKILAVIFSRLWGYFSRLWVSFFIFTRFSNLCILNREYLPKVKINMNVLIECGTSYYKDNSDWC